MVVCECANTANSMADWGNFCRQLTVQELSTMMHLDLKPIIFVINNGGYSIERFLHGPTRSFNDIVNWYEYGLLVERF
jgi:pyruvate decarboxylase